jgi:hypothetical protein
MPVDVERVDRERSRRRCPEPTSIVPVVSIVIWTKIGIRSSPVARPASTSASLTPLTAAFVGQQVLVGLAQEQVDAAVDQPARLLGIRVLEDVVRRVVKRSELGAGDRSSRSHSGGRSACRVRDRRPRAAISALRRLISRVRSATSNSARHDLVRAERVGFDAIGARFEIADVRRLRRSRARQVEDLGAVLHAEKVLLDIPVMGLDPRAHRSIAEQDAGAQSVEKAV